MGCFVNICLDNCVAAAITVNVGTHNVYCVCTVCDVNLGLVHSRVRAKDTILEKRRPLYI